ncbi:SRPBCC family protein [Minwuia sp.]|uniref:SRPBCC family protein n=1 Tax=Minwuia sp. TaxID=2493630 RepID=UPI003A901D67
MKISGSYDIEADRQTVWEALNDPEILKACIPGCESLDKTENNELTAVVTAKVGPVKAKFNGTVELKDLNPPESYRIEGSGKGGAAGFAKGGADVKLTEIEGGTNLTYEADAQVGGKLAQIGGRLIDGTAKKMADQFFANFREQVGAGSSDTEATAAASTEPAEEPPVAIAVEGAPDPQDAAEPAKPDQDAEAKTPEESMKEQEIREAAAQNAAAAAVSGVAVAPDPQATAGAVPEAEKTSGLPVWVWFVGAVALIIVLVALAA